MILVFKDQRKKRHQHFLISTKFEISKTMISNFLTSNHQTFWLISKSDHCVIMCVISPLKHSYYPLFVWKRLLFIRKVNRGIQKSEHRICFEFPARAGNLKLIPRLIFWTPKCFFWKFSQARIVKKYAFFEFLVGVRLQYMKLHTKWSQNQGKSKLQLIIIT